MAAPPQPDLGFQRGAELFDHVLRLGITLADHQQRIVTGRALAVEDERRETVNAELLRHLEIGQGGLANAFAAEGFKKNLFRHAKGRSVARQHRRLGDILTLGIEGALDRQHERVIIPGAICRIVTTAREAGSLS